MTPTIATSLNAPQSLHLTPPQVSQRSLIQVHRLRVQVERVEIWRAKDRLIERKRKIKAAVVADVVLLATVGVTSNQSDHQDSVVSLYTCDAYGSS